MLGLLPVLLTIAMGYKPRGEHLTRNRRTIIVPLSVTGAAVQLLLQGLPYVVGGSLLLSFDAAHLSVTIVSAMVPAIGVAECVAAIGLLRLKTWARLLGVVTGALGTLLWLFTFAVLPLGSWIGNVTVMALLSFLYIGFLMRLFNAKTQKALAAAASARGRVSFVYLREPSWPPL